jgi:hypothetical protein
MSSIDTNSLMDSISQLLEIRPDVLHAITNEVRSADIPYKALYGDFHVGGTCPEPIGWHAKWHAHIVTPVCGGDSNAPLTHTGK